MINGYAIVLTQACPSNSKASPTVPMPDWGMSLGEKLRVFTALGKKIVQQSLLRCGLVKMTNVFFS